MVLLVEKELDDCRTVVLSHITLERRVIGFFQYPFVGMWIPLHSGKNAVTVGCIRGENPIQPHVSDVFIMHMVVE